MKLPGVGSCVLLLSLSCAPARAPGPAAVSPPTPAQARVATEAMERKIERLRREGPKPMAKPDEAARLFVERRLPPGETRLPLDHLRDVLDEIRARQETARLGAQVPGDLRRWDWLGPGNVGGRTRALVINPQNPDIMYAAGVAGGIWKSIDGGASWNPTDDFMLNLAVCSLAMDPNDPDVLYAGTGEGFFQLSIFVQGAGIFKSTDAGATWNRLAGTVSGVPDGAFDFVNKIVISPNNSQRVYAATRTGVWRSVNGGETWSVMLANPTYVSHSQQSRGSPLGCTDLVVRSDRFPDVLFAAFGSTVDDGLYASVNNGNTWQGYGVPTNQGRMTPAPAPSDQDVLYLLMADNGSVGAFGQMVQVFRSVDGGATFTPMVDLSSTTGPWLLSNLALATGCFGGFPPYSQGWYDNIIAVDPTDPDTVWVGGIDIFRSSDGGQTFDVAGYSVFASVEPVLPYSIHGDHHIFVFHPDYDGTNNQTMYVGNDGGLYRTQNARAAASLETCPISPAGPLPEIAWERLNNGYGVTQFYHGDSARQRDVFAGGAQDNGTNLVDRTGAPNDWQRIFGGDGGYVAIDPTDPDTMYVEYHVFPSVRKSTDGGETFTEMISGITESSGFHLAPLHLAPDDPQTLWTGGEIPWRSQDGAATWQAVGPDFSGPDTITAIAFAPSNPDVVYLGFENGYVARTTSARAANPSWDVLVTGLYAAYVSSIAVDPNDADVAYLTYSTYGVPHVLRTLDGGQTWSPRDGSGVTGIPDLPAHWVAIRPCNSEQLYVGTELGVFVSDDRGATWQPANDGLANTVVQSLDFQDDDTLVAFTHGRGAYRAELVPCVTRDRPFEHRHGTAPPPRR